MAVAYVNRKSLSLVFVVVDDDEEKLITLHFLAWKGRESSDLPHHPHDDDHDDDGAPHPASTNSSSFTHRDCDQLIHFMQFMRHKENLSLRVSGTRKTTGRRMINACPSTDRYQRRASERTTQHHIQRTERTDLCPSFFAPFALSANTVILIPFQTRICYFVTDYEARYTNTRPHISPDKGKQ